MDLNRATKTITFSFNEKTIAPPFSADEGSHLYSIENTNIEDVVNSRYISFSFVYFFHKFLTLSFRSCSSYRDSKDFGFVISLKESASLKLKGPSPEVALSGIEKVEIIFSNAEKHADIHRMYELLKGRVDADVTTPMKPYKKVIIDDANSTQIVNRYISLFQT